MNTEIIRKISKLTVTNKQTSDKREGGGKEGSEKMKSSPVKISILTTPCEKNLSLIICYYTEKEAPFLGTKHLYHKKRLLAVCTDQYSKGNFVSPRGHVIYEGDMGGF